MKPISAWTLSSQENLEKGNLILKKEFGGFLLNIIFDGFSIWFVAYWPNGGKIAFRAGSILNNVPQKIAIAEENSNGANFVVIGTAGTTKITLTIPDLNKPIFRYTVIYTPSIDILLLNSQRDILPLFKGNGKTQNTSGTIHASQIGLRSGQLFFSMDYPETGSVFYFQNLTALNKFCETTETSAGDIVGGTWPEIGMKLPTSSPEKPLKKDEEYTLSDAFIVLSNEIPKDNYQISVDFLNHLAAIYRLLPIPETMYRDWPKILQNGLDGLTNHKGCWQFADGNSYLNAYVSDYKTPPESMVQLAVLLPLLDYDQWSGEDHHPVIDMIQNGLEKFFDPQLGTIVRWLPSLEKNLDWSEEQKEPDVMDSWYLHHPMLNLSRLALKGNKIAKKLLLDSIDYVIKVAHHFNYEWPVFYKMATLEVLKKEASPGEGGEKDVAGSYAHVMLQVYKLTAEKKYLEESIKAAKKLDGLGFDIFYQANTTAFSAGALLRLYKETNEKLFLDLSHLCIAAIFKNVQLWECNYGNAKNYSTFFAVYPLKDAPYTAAYEEQEVFSAFHEFLEEAEGVEEVLPSARLLISECLRNIINRVAYYYPPMLPADVIAPKEEVKTGEIDLNLWVALEDMQDGWNKSGQVGQEVYGAGVAFGIVPRQYHKVKEADFMIFTDYPTKKFRNGHNEVTFQLHGDSELHCRLVVLPLHNKKMPEINVEAGMVSTDRKTVNPTVEDATNRYEFKLPGNTSVKITWQK